MKKILLLALLVMLEPGCLRRHTTVTTTPPPVIIYVDPNTINLVSGQQQQFTATVSNTTNTAVNWYSCASGAITSTGLFTAPVVSTPGNICVYAISQADPSKSSTSYALVSPPPPVTACGNPYGTPGEIFYQLPSWDAQNFLSFIQPADVIYGGSQTHPTTQSDPGWKLNPVQKVGDLYCEHFLVQGGVPPYAYSVENPTPGLTMHSVDGLYTGTATTSGVFTNILICATDAAGSHICLSPQTQQVCDGVSFCNGFGSPLLPPPPLPTR
jgi:hypothetical protein